MKNLRGTIIAIIAFLALSATCHASDQVSTVLAPLSTERITILTGDKAVMALGQNDGVIKGDVGSIAADESEAAKGAFIGQCAVIKSGYGSAICEMITIKKEAEPGDKIFFERVTYTDPNLYPVAIALLSDVVEPYEPYKQLNLMVYGIFDERNDVTGLSEILKGEITGIFSQTKRIHMVDSSEFKDLIFYPGAGRDVFQFARNKMKKADIDVLLLGKYLSDGQTVTLTMTQLSAGGADKSWRFSFPQATYADSLTRIVLSAQEETQVENYPCSIFVKGNTARLRRANEKAEVIQHEADGNAFTELSLKRSDFNVVSPVDIKVRIDDAVVLQGPTDGLTVPVSPGSHRVVVSFRRGYFFDESLVYTSQKEVVKEIGLDFHRIKNLSIDIDLSPLFERDAIGLKVVEPAGREKQVVEPIRRVESGKTVEVFKD